MYLPNRKYHTCEGFLQRTRITASFIIIVVGGNRSSRIVLPVGNDAASLLQFRQVKIDNNRVFYL